MKIENLDKILMWYFVFIIFIALLSGCVCMTKTQFQKQMTAYETMGYIKAQIDFLKRENNKLNRKLNKDLWEIIDNNKLKENKNEKPN